MQPSNSVISESPAAIRAKSSAVPPLRVGFILLDQFTLAGFAGLIDSLRLAADAGGRSRQIYAAWTIMSDEGLPRQSSCGATLSDNSPLLAPAEFDYIAICGGNDYLRAAKHSPSLLNYLRLAHSQRVRLIGVCTGTFAIAKAGLLKGHRVCVNWNVIDAFKAQFPTVPATADNLYVDEGDIITCAGSTSAIDLGLYLIARHCGHDKARQATRHMILQDIRPAALPQPHFYDSFDGVQDARIHQIAHFMEQRIDNPPSVAAAAHHIGVSVRQLERMFHLSLGVSPAAFQRRMRIKYGRWLLENSNKTVTEIAFDCGFADTAHFSREFRTHYQQSPSELRRNFNAR